MSPPFAPMPPIPGPRVILEPVRPEHAEALRELSARPEVARWWGEPEPGWPLDSDDEVGFAIVLAAGPDAGPAPRGFVQYAEESDSQYRHASIDVFLDPDLHGRGIGREVVAVLAAHLIDVRGHHRLTIDPAAHNATAIACYAAVGFRPVGVLRRYEQGPNGAFHDGLLMDLLAEELVRV